MSVSTKLLGALLATSLASFAIVGCAAPMLDEEMEESESDLSGTRNVSLKYEGSCSFLKTCSRYSRGLPDGKVSWGCTGVGVCSDTAKWVAGPNRSYCGKTVKICHGSQCTNAVVKDVSISRDWEAGNGVLDAIDLPHGINARCSGYGGGRVTLSVGRASEPEPDDDNTDGPTSEPPSDVDNGCFSASCQKDMPELACVQSKKTRAFYQCKNGKWYRGTSDSGPYGDCASSHPIGGCGD